MIRLTFGSLLLAWLGVQPAVVLSATGCEQVRAAIDIGSGTTKMLIARVDTCSRQVITVLAPGAGERLEQPVRLKDGIVTGSSGESVFGPRVEKTLFAVLDEFKKIGEAHGAKVFSAAATSAFRQVSLYYRQGLIRRIVDRVGIPVHVVRHAEEARLGYSAAATELDASPDDLLVWDIGGGSMQISYRVEGLPGVRGYKQRYANDWVLDFVRSCLKQRGFKVAKSPNPVVNVSDRSEPHNCLQAAIRKAQDIARSTATATQLAAFRKYPLVVGIGGVHVYSNCEITAQEPECGYEREQLYEAIVSHAHLTDEELVQAGRAGSMAYAPMRITAGALTVGYMRAFNLGRVRTLKIDMAHGIILEPAYWDEKGLDFPHFSRHAPASF